MPVYTFDLRDGSLGISDQEGVSLPDREQAFDYAAGVVYELLVGNELEARKWRLDVYENGRAIFAIPFAKFDHSLDHLSPGMRRTVEIYCDRTRSLKEAMATAQATMRESRALVALSRGKPYLAAVRGVGTIRA